MSAKNVKPNNKKIGSDFEQKFCQYFFKKGFWAHFLNPAPDGSQPFDVILIKNGRAIAIDCKTVEGKSFPLDRIEPNQESAFKLMQECRNTENYFALKISESELIFVPAAYLLGAKKVLKSIKIDTLKEKYGIINFK